MRRGYIDKSIGKARSKVRKRVENRDNTGGDDNNNNNNIINNDDDDDDDDDNNNNNDNKGDNPAAISSGVVRVLRVHERAREVDEDGDAPPTYLIKSDLAEEVP